MAKTTVIECTDGLTTAQLAVALGVDSAPEVAVRVNGDQLERFARFLVGRPQLQLRKPARWDDRRFWNVEAEDVARSQYLAIGNAINFRFWDRHEDSTVVPAVGILDGDRFRGAMYMWRCLRRTVDAGKLPLLDADFLSEISEDEFDVIFTDDRGVNPLSPAKSDRIANWRDLGIHLREHWGGLVLQPRSVNGRLSRAFRAAVGADQGIRRSGPEADDGQCNPAQR